MLSGKGEIEHLLLAVPHNEARQFGDVYCGLIDALPVAMQVTLVAEKAAVPIVRNWLSRLAVQRDLQIIDAGSKACLTPWVRDGQHALSPDEKGRPRFLIPTDSCPKNETCIAQVLRTTNLCDVITAPFEFEGGNLLFTADHLFVGADTIAGVAGRNDEDKLSAFTAALAEFVPVPRKAVLVKSHLPISAETAYPSSLNDKPWQEVFYFRSRQGTRQPLFHIDMFISLAGKTSDGRQRILVGDPALAARLLGEDVHPCALAEHFDAIADDLRQEDLEVVRNPVAYIYMDRSEHAKRIWFHATSNNVLVQDCDQAGNIVWLPQFGHDNWPKLAVTDTYNQQLWESFGYKVHLIPKCQLLAENAGGIHCMTNVLERG